MAWVRLTLKKAPVAFSGTRCMMEEAWRRMQLTVLGQPRLPLESNRELQSRAKPSTSTTFKCKRNASNKPRTAMACLTLNLPQTHKISAGACSPGKRPKSSAARMMRKWIISIHRWLMRKERSGCSMRAKPKASGKFYHTWSNLSSPIKIWAA